MQFKIPANWRRWLLALSGAIAATVTLVVAIDIDGDGTPDVTVRGGYDPAALEQYGVDRDNQREAHEVKHTRSAEAGLTRHEQAPGLLGGDPLELVHEDMRDETPPGVTQADVDHGRDRGEAIADRQLNEPIEPAGAQGYSCRPSIVVNRSALSTNRKGVALHFTVSPWGSLGVIRGLFNTRSFGASSNYGIEVTANADGGCELWVPENEKAWAQGAFNSDYVSIEIVTYDLSRAQWLATPFIKNGTLAALVRDIALRHGAPLKLVDPVGCTPIPGITDHDRLECGNNHWDVGPGFPWDVFMRQVRQGVKVTRLNALERKLVAKRCHHYRQHVAAADGSAVARRNLGWARHYRHRIREQKRKLATNRRRAGDPWKRYHRGGRYQELSRAETGRSCR